MMDAEISEATIDHIAQRLAEKREPKGAQKFITTVTPWATCFLAIIGAPWCIWVTTSLFKLDPGAARYTAKDAELHKLTIQSDIRSAMDLKFQSVDNKLDAIAQKAEARADALKLSLDRINLTLAAKGIDKP
jgi:hypothetical protein